MQVFSGASAQLVKLQRWKCWPGISSSFQLITIEQIDLRCLISSLHLTAMIKYLAAVAWWKQHIIKTESAGLQQRAGRYSAKSTLLWRRICGQSPPASDQTFSITCHRAPLLACFCTHSRTHRWICSRRFSQSAPSSITRGRCYSHNSLASSALTRRPVLPPSIMSRKLQFPHVSYRELWSALIEYSWYFPRSRYWPRGRDSFCGKLT